jgi:hypothetical protein
MNYVISDIDLFQYESAGHTVFWVRHAMKMSCFCERAGHLRASQPSAGEAGEIRVWNFVKISSPYWRINQTNTKARRMNQTNEPDEWTRREGLLFFTLWGSCCISCEDLVVSFGISFLGRHRGVEGYGSASSKQQFTKYSHHSGFWKERIAILSGWYNIFRWHHIEQFSNPAYLTRPIHHSSKMDSKWFSRIYLNALQF